MGKLPSEKKSFWHRFVRGKTDLQRVILSLSAFAGAVVVLIGLAVAGYRFFDGDDGSRQGEIAAGKVVQVVSQTESADQFVEYLLAVAADGRAVQLDHQITAPKGNGHYRLEYNCQSQPCNFVRLEAEFDQPAETRDGVWYQGCWSVVKDGAGFGAERLDLELRLHGDTCP